LVIRTAWHRPVFNKKKQLYINAKTFYDQKKLKNVVKDVVAEEDRSRNLMVFGLEEEPGEQISEKVSQVLLQLGEKPIIEASRISLIKDS